MLFYIEKTISNQLFFQCKEIIERLTQIQLRAREEFLE